MSHRPIRRAVHASALLALLILPWPVSAQEMRRVEPVPTHGSGVLDAGQWSAAASMRAIAAEPDSGSSSAVLPLIGAMVGGGVALIASNDCQRTSGCISFGALAVVAGALLGAAVGFVIELALE